MSFKLSDYQLFLQGKALFAPITTTVENRGVTAITGASGSGKSTIMADISGVLPMAFVSRGELVLNSRNLRPLPIEKRKVGILFQDDLLFPHLNVYDNLVYGLDRKLSASEKQNRICGALREADLPGYDSRDISTLSGGQRARVSLIRTLLSEPELILLDEPFSKLDKTLRQQFRQWVFEYIAQMNIPTLLVTHDNEDIPVGSHVIHLEKDDA